MERPVYFCGPPVAQQTISVARYLKPAGGTLWWASLTAGFAFRARISHDAVDKVINNGCDAVDTAKALIKTWLMLCGHKIPLKGFFALSSYQANQS